MSSINTNAGAMTALQTLKATNKNLETTQGRISTGARVNEAAHNAAYWSIATTMRSDNNAMSTVKDALGLGAAQVDIAYTAMDAVKDTLDTMKSKLVAAQQPDIDKAKIQEEIVQLQNDLKTYAKSATFSGGNWLDVENTAVQKVVASFVRDAENNISLATIDVDTSKTALFTSGDSGLLQGTGNWSTGGLEIGGGTAATWDGTAGEAATATMSGFGGVTLADGDKITFTISYGGESKDYVLSTPAAIADDAALITALNTAAGTDFTATQADGVITLTGPAAAAAENGKKLEIVSIVASSANGLDATGFDISEASTTDLASLMNGIDQALASVTTAASDLGAIKTRISSQSDFVGKIMDAVDRGVGQLVDADMEQESSRLQALQVQQQLGIQALSIANGNTQNILSLFR